MKSLSSYNELASWKWDQKDNFEQKNNQVSEYFQCISECDIVDSNARRFCRHILTEEQFSPKTDSGVKHRISPALGLGIGMHRHFIN